MSEACRAIQANRKRKFSLTRCHLTRVPSRSTQTRRQCKTKQHDLVRANIAKLQTTKAKTETFIVWCKRRLSRQNGPPRCNRKARDTRSVYLSDNGRFCELFLFPSAQLFDPFALRIHTHGGQTGALCRCVAEVFCTIFCEQNATQSTKRTTALCGVPTDNKFSFADLQHFDRPWMSDMTNRRRGGRFMCGGFVTVFRPESNAVVIFLDQKKEQNHFEKNTDGSVSPCSLRVPRLTENSHLLTFTPLLFPLARSAE